MDDETEIVKQAVGISFLVYSLLQHILCSIEILFYTLDKKL